MERCDFCGGEGHTRYGCPVADEMFRDLKQDTRPKTGEEKAK